MSDSSASGILLIDINIKQVMEKNLKYQNVFPRKATFLSCLIFSYMDPDNVTHTQLRLHILQMDCACGEDLCHVKWQLEREIERLKTTNGNNYDDYAPVQTAKGLSESHPSLNEPIRSEKDMIFCHSNI